MSWVTGVTNNLSKNNAQISKHPPIPADVRSKAQVCGNSTVRIVASNTAEGVVVRLLFVVCFVDNDLCDKLSLVQRSPNVCVCVCVCVCVVCVYVSALWQFDCWDRWFEYR